MQFEENTSQSKLLVLKVCRGSRRERNERGGLHWGGAWSSMCVYGLDHTFNSNAFLHKPLVTFDAVHVQQVRDRDHVHVVALRREGRWGRSVRDLSFSKKI